MVEKGVREGACGWGVNGEKELNVEGMFLRCNRMIAVIEQTYVGFGEKDREREASVV